MLPLQPRRYSQRLGVLTPEQLQAALDRFALGTLLAAEPLDVGLFGQNVFLSSTAGEFVLRGCPHTDWQFPKERCFARMIHDETELDAPWPYLLEPSPGVFGWPFALVPRLSGRFMRDREEALLRADERDGIAVALGEGLATLHAVAAEQPGEYSLGSDTIEPLGMDYPAWVADAIRDIVAACRPRPNAMTLADAAWTETVVRGADAALRVRFRPTLVHEDYKLENLALGVGASPRVTGVVDLMTAHVGDGEVDLSRTTAALMDNDAARARLFVRAYLDQRAPRSGFRERFRVYMLRERLAIWEYGTRHDWFIGRAFREWVSPYVEFDPVA